MINQMHDQDLMVVYHNALKALYLLTNSTRLYYLHDEMKDPVTLLGQKIQYLNGQLVHTLVPENQKAILGDYWRVLRLRPPTNQFSAEKPHLKYIPNNTYGYNEVRVRVRVRVRVTVREGMGSGVTHV